MRIFPRVYAEVSIAFANHSGDHALFAWSIPVDG